MWSVRLRSTAPTTTSRTASSSTFVTWLPLLARLGRHQPIEWLAEPAESLVYLVYGEIICDDGEPTTKDTIFAVPDDLKNPVLLRRIFFESMWGSSQVFPPSKEGRLILVKRDKLYPKSKDIPLHPGYWIKYKGNHEALRSLLVNLKMSIPSDTGKYFSYAEQCDLNKFYISCPIDKLLLCRWCINHNQRVCMWWLGRQLINIWRISWLQTNSWEIWSITLRCFPMPVKCLASTSR